MIFSASEPSGCGWLIAANAQQAHRGPTTSSPVFLPACLWLQVTYKRLQDTLAVLSKPGGSAGSEQLPGLALIDVMFGSRQPQFAAATPKWKANNTRLDSSQVRWHLCTLCTAEPAGTEQRSKLR